MRKTCRAVQWWLFGLIVAFPLGSALPQAQICTNVTTGTLRAGQTKYVGSLTVQNMSEDGQQYLYGLTCSVAWSSMSCTSRQARI